MFSLELLDISDMTFKLSNHFRPTAPFIQTSGSWQASTWNNASLYDLVLCRSTASSHPLSWLAMERVGQALAPLRVSVLLPTSLVYQAAKSEGALYPRVFQPNAELTCFDGVLVGRGSLNLPQLAEWEVAEGNRGTDSICRPASIPHSESPFFIASP